MTKREVKDALTTAIIEMNEEAEEYIRDCDESVRDDYRKIATAVMGCFERFRDIITELAD